MLKNVKVLYHASIVLYDNIYIDPYKITGDTDVNEDIQNIKCDVLFVPIGGTYTMDYKEAADYTNSIKPKYVIPIHYGTIVGKKEDGIEFAKLLDTKIECLIFNK